jgi:hypothetical protein
MPWQRRNNSHPPTAAWGHFRTHAAQHHSTVGPGEQLLDCALRRSMPGTKQHAFLQRLERSLDMWGSLTPVMVESLHGMLTARSSHPWQANGQQAKQC